MRPPSVCDNLTRMGWRSLGTWLLVGSSTACGLGVDWDAFARPPEGDAPERVDASDASAVADGGGRTYADAVRASRPIAYYRFEEDDGAPVTSDVAGAPSGVIEDDGRHVAGRVGRAIRLDGAGGDRVSFGDAFSLLLDRDRSFSVEMLVDVERLNTDYARIFSLEAVGDSVSSGTLVFARATELAFQRSDATGKASMFTKRGPLPLGVFVHLVAACDAVSCRLVIDGVATEAAAPGVSAPPNDGPFSLGARSKNSNNVLGVFDELAIYDHALTDAEIAAHRAALP